MIETVIELESSFQSPALCTTTRPAFSRHADCISADSANESLCMIANSIHLDICELIPAVNIECQIDAVGLDSYYNQTIHDRIESGVHFNNALSLRDGGKSTLSLSFPIQDPLSTVLDGGTLVELYLRDCAWTFSEGDALTSKRGNDLRNLALIEPVISYWQLSHEHFTDLEGVSDMGNDKTVVKAAIKVDFRFSISHDLEDYALPLKNGHGDRYYFEPYPARPSWSQAFHTIQHDPVDCALLGLLAMVTVIFFDVVLFVMGDPQPKPGSCPFILGAVRKIFILIWMTIRAYLCTGKSSFDCMILGLLESLACYKRFCCAKVKSFTRSVCASWWSIWWRVRTIATSCKRGIHFLPGSITSSLLFLLGSFASYQTSCFDKIKAFTRSVCSSCGNTWWRIKTIAGSAMTRSIILWISVVTSLASLPKYYLWLLQSRLRSSTSCEAKSEMGTEQNPGEVVMTTPNQKERVPCPPTCPITFYKSRSPESTVLNDTCHERSPSIKCVRSNLLFDMEPRLLKSMDTDSQPQVILPTTVNFVNDRSICNKQLAICDRADFESVDSRQSFPENPSSELLTLANTDSSETVGGDLTSCRDKHDDVDCEGTGDSELPHPDVNVVDLSTLPAHEISATDDVDICSDEETRSEELVLAPWEEMTCNSVVGSQSEVERHSSNVLGYSNISCHSISVSEVDNKKGGVNKEEERVDEYRCIQKNFLEFDVKKEIGSEAKAVCTAYQGLIDAEDDAFESSLTEDNLLELDGIVQSEKTCALSLEEANQGATKRRLFVETDCHGNAPQSLPLIGSDSISVHNFGGDRENHNNDTDRDCASQDCSANDQLPASVPVPVLRFKDGGETYSIIEAVYTDGKGDINVHDQKNNTDHCDRIPVSRLGVITNGPDPASPRLLKKVIDHFPSTDGSVVESPKLGGMIVETNFYSAELRVQDSIASLESMPVESRLVCVQKDATQSDQKGIHERTAALCATDGDNIEKTLSEEDESFSPEAIEEKGADVTDDASTVMHTKVSQFGMVNSLRIDLLVQNEGSPSLKTSRASNPALTRMSMQQELLAKLKTRPNFVDQTTPSAKPNLPNSSVGELSPCSRLQHIWSQRKIAPNKIRTPDVFVAKDVNAKSLHPPPRVKSPNNNFSQLMAKWSNDGESSPSVTPLKKTSPEKVGGKNVSPFLQSNSERSSTKPKKIQPLSGEFTGGSRSNIEEEYATIGETPLSFLDEMLG